MIRFLLAAAVVLAAAPFAASAQPAPAQEIARIQARLDTLQQQARQDSAVKAAEAAFAARVQDAMVRLDPAARDRAARAAGLGAEVEAARAAGDTARLNALAAEAQALQAYFAELRPRALALPEIQESRRAYLQVLFARMKAIDPQTQVLVDSLRSLRGG